VELVQACLLVCVHQDSRPSITRSVFRYTPYIHVLACVLLLQTLREASINVSDETGKKRTEQTIESTHFPAKTAPPEQIVASRFAVKGGLWSDRHINLFCPGGSHPRMHSSALLNPSSLLTHIYNNLRQYGIFPQTLFSKL
jgi:hypothetical protein